MSFQLRTLFRVITTAALSIPAAASDWIAGVGIMTAFGGFQLSAYLKDRSTPFPWFRILVIAVSATLLWFSAVDVSSWFVCCDVCELHHDVTEYRLFGRPIYTIAEPYHPKSRAKLYTDLGFPCAHEFQRTHLVRWWGMVYAARPCDCILCCIGESSYNERISRNVRRFSARSPKEASRLHQKIQSGDIDLKCDFVDAMRHSSHWTPREPNTK